MRDTSTTRPATVALKLNRSEGVRPNDEGCTVLPDVAQSRLACVTGCAGEYHRDTGSLTWFPDTSRSTVITCYAPTPADTPMRSVGPA